MDTQVALLEVNVLIALAWPSHVHHTRAHDWFSRRGSRGWATSPVTETGFVRVSSNTSVIPYAVSPVEALDLLTEMTRVGRHEFWPDDVHGVIGPELDGALVVGHSQVTDAHLLAVALSHGGVVATLDRTMSTLAPRARTDAVEMLL